MRTQTVTKLDNADLSQKQTSDTFDLRMEYGFISIQLEWNSVDADGGYFLIQRSLDGECWDEVDALYATQNEEEDGYSDGYFSPDGYAGTGIGTGCDISEYRIIARYVRVVWEPEGTTTGTGTVKMTAFKGA